MLATPAPNTPSQAQNVQLGNQILDKRLAQKTKRAYERKGKSFDDWIRANHPEYVTRDRIRYERLDGDIFTEFFGHICRKVDRKTGEYLFSDPEKTKPRFQTYDHVNGYRSAIMHRYKTQNVNMLEDASKTIAECMGGYKRMVQDLKQDGELPWSEGKAPMKFAGYRHLAKYAMHQTSDFNVSVFAHLFLLLCWNLIARINSVSSLMFEHISWTDDAMVIVFPSHKGDKEGKNCQPKHVYANPDNPEICPVLSMAIFLWSYGFRRSAAKRTLFGGDEDNNNRFSKWLRSVCEVLGDTLVNLGMMILEIGSHSFRKGVACFLSSLPCGPTSIAIYLRAGWSLGNVPNRYILEGQGGDQLCGRAATGLTLTDPAFAVLPPHFDLSDGPILSDEQWNAILPGFSTFYPANFRQVCPYLLASLAYHRSYLESHLAPNHPLKLSRVWTSGILQQVLPRVLTGCNRNPVSKMMATGVPATVMLANEIVGLKQEISYLKVAIMQRLDELPDRLKEQMLENFAINGAIPITRDQVSELLSGLQANLIQQMERHAATWQARAASVVDPAPISGTNAQVLYSTWCWGGGIHLVPEGWRFPRCATNLLWDLWWSGNPAEKICPYRMIKPCDLCAADGVLLSKAKKVMNALLDYAGKTRIQVAQMCLHDRDELFASSFVGLFAAATNHMVLEEFDKRRVGSLSYVTLYDYLNRNSSV